MTEIQNVEILKYTQFVLRFLKNKMKHNYYCQISKTRNPCDKKVSSDPCQQCIVVLLTKDSLKIATAIIIIIIITIIIIIIIIIYAKTYYLNSKK